MFILHECQNEIYFLSVRTLKVRADKAETNALFTLIGL